MKNYLKLIKYLQQILLAIAISTMVALPLILVLREQALSSTTTQNLFFISHLFLFFVMMVRPLADILPAMKWIRPLVVLRKGAGVMSASIIVSFIFAKLITDPASYLGSIGTLRYWAMQDYAVLGHLADLSAIILIITSNKLSKKILGTWWKKVQKLAYVYFYGSAFYVFLSYGNLDQLIAIVLVTTVTVIAYLLNRERRKQQLIQATIQATI